MKEDFKTQKFLCIGHCCHDKLADSYILGGTVSYASIVAKTLGVEVSILTSVGDDFLFKNEFDKQNIPFHSIPASSTTVFHNREGENGKRTQHILARAGTIEKGHISPGLIKFPIILIGSIACEIGNEMASLFKNSLVGGVLQGMIRTWDHKGLVSSKAINWESLADFDIIFLSDDDILGLEDHLPSIINMVDQVVITHGSEGATVYQNDYKFFFPSYETEAVDSTGAGDTFSTVYLLKYASSKNVKLSAQYAHCAASIIVEGIGLDKAFGLSELEKRVHIYQTKIMS